METCTSLAPEASLWGGLLRTLVLLKKLRFGGVRGLEPAGKTISLSFAAGWGPENAFCLAKMPSGTLDKMHFT